MDMLIELKLNLSLIFGSFLRKNGCFFRSHRMIDGSSGQLINHLRSWSLISGMEQISFKISIDFIIASSFLVFPSVTASVGRD